MTSAERVDVGFIVEYGRPLNPLVRKEKIIVQLQSKVIEVFMEKGQLDVFRRSHPPGSLVAVGYYGGAWHVGVARQDGPAGMGGDARGGR